MDSDRHARLDRAMTVMAVPVGPISAWSLMAIFGWLVVVAFFWLLFVAYGRQSGA